MKLSNIALLAVRGLGRNMVLKLVDALGVHENTVYKMIRNNEDGLTKAAALQVIRQETGLNDDQILETETENAA